MAWIKQGLIYSPQNGPANAPANTPNWASHSFKAPCPWQRDADTIRLFGGMRDDSGISRIGWVDTSAQDLRQVLGVSRTPILDRCPQGPFIGALHSIAALPEGGYRAWISRGFGWQKINDILYPAYDCWTLTSADGLHFDNATAQRIIAPGPSEWDSEMTRYPAHLRTQSGDQFLFYNGNGMGQTGVGLARWSAS